MLCLCGLSILETVTLCHTALNDYEVDLPFLNLFIETEVMKSSQSS